MLSFEIDALIQTALKEDIPYADLSSSIFAPEHHSKAYLLAKQDGVFCGAQCFTRTFELLDQSTVFNLRKKDGDRFQSGDVLLELETHTAPLLQGERTALNFLQHLSGIATTTARMVELLRGTRCAVTDTRKTLPGLRSLQKYAVACGGGKNHRFGLSDAVMLKDNHIDACGSIAEAIAAVRRNIGHMVKIEVETRTLDEVEQALDACADVIMFDNMSITQMERGVALARNHKNGIRVVMEASGDVTDANIRAIAETGVDVISLGMLTHSVRTCNISMRIG
ncbi:MAG: carboxylating nicotinate-nucleotide diphosphorylase [Oscillospiraceae bacterium]|jgi:nicotinate-nucleotide pyrophosphorylase (carboxylating)|nr:carboxylating nicotinate-nucleotide diphosphorylase [Oscillospiraceae bacterium]